MPILPHARPDSAQAAHRLPPAGRRALRRRADGPRGIRGHLVAALSHPSADDGEVGAAAPRRDVGSRCRHAAAASALPHRAARRRAAAPRSTASRCSSTTTSRCSTSQPDEQDAHFYRNAQADEVRLRRAKGRACSRRCSATCRSRRATTSSSIATSCTASGSTSTSPRKLLVIESRGHVRRRSATGTTSARSLEGAPYCERDIRRPDASSRPTTRRATSRSW